MIAPGLDAFEDTPFGGLRVSTRGFGEIARRIAVALSLPTLPLLVLLLLQEGGYLCDALGDNLASFLEGFGAA